MKFCKTCSTEKIVTEFYAAKKSADGLQYQCKGCDKARVRSPEVQRRSVNKYRAKHAERVKIKTREHMRAWRKGDPEAAKTYWREWARANPAKNRARVNRYRVAKGQAVVGRYDAAIEAVYQRAEILSLVTPHAFHVDHIVPLRGRGVCGLHVPWNLQCILAAENSRKSNKLVA